MGGVWACFSEPRRWATAGAHEERSRTRTQDQDPGPRADTDPCSWLRQTSPCSHCRRRTPRRRGRTGPSCSCTRRPGTGASLQVKPGVRTARGFGSCGRVPRVTVHPAPSMGRQQARTNQGGRHRGGPLGQCAETPSAHPSAPCTGQTFIPHLLMGRREAPSSCPESGIKDTEASRDRACGHRKGAMNSPEGA